MRRPTARIGRRLLHGGLARPVRAGARQPAGLRRIGPSAREGDVVLGLGPARSAAPCAHLGRAIAAAGARALELLTAVERYPRTHAARGSRGGSGSAAPRTAPMATATTSSSRAGRGRLSVRRAPRWLGRGRARQGGRGAEDADLDRRGAAASRGGGAHGAAAAWAEAALRLFALDGGRQIFRAGFRRRRGR